MTTAALRFVRVRGRMRVRMRLRRTPTHSTRRHGTDLTGGQKHVAICASESRRNICRARSSLTRRHSISTARGNTTRRTDTFGIRRWRLAGVRTTTGAGFPIALTDGRGSVSAPGRGQRITTDGGGSRPGHGSGSPDTVGALRGSRGRMLPATSAGVRLAGTIMRFCRSDLVLVTTRGAHGRSCRTATSVTDTCTRITSVGTGSTRTRVPRSCRALPRPHGAVTPYRAPPHRFT